MSHEFKVCPSCDEEFTLASSECGDCGAVLVFPGEATIAEPEDFPPISELMCVRVGPLPWTRALSARLSEHEIAHRVERDARSVEEGGAEPKSFGGEDVYGTWVEPDDYDEAKQIDRDIFSMFEPEHEPETEGDELCPACQEPLASEALECASCGLSFD